MRREMQKCSKQKNLHVQNARGKRKHGVSDQLILTEPTTHSACNPLRDLPAEPAQGTSQRSRKSHSSGFHTLYHSCVTFHLHFRCVQLRAKSSYPRFLILASGGESWHTSRKLHSGLKSSLRPQHLGEVLSLGTAVSYCCLPFASSSCCLAVLPDLSHPG